MECAVIVIARIVKCEFCGTVADNLPRLIGGAAGFFISRQPAVVLPQLRERNGVGQHLFGVARPAVADGVGGRGGALVGLHGGDYTGAVGHGQARCTAGHDLHGAEHEAEQGEGAHVAGAGCEITA